MKSIIALLIDESQSMRHFEVNAKATQEGANTFLEMQQIRADDCVYHQGFFATNLHIHQRFVPLSKAEPIAYYWPCGSNTFLYSCTTEFIEGIEHKIASLPAEERPTSVTVVVQTDGGEAWEEPDGKGGTQERASFRIVKEKIAAKTKEGWRFIFLACGAAAAEAGERMGFDPKWTVVYTAGKAAATTFEKASMAILEELVAPGTGKGV